MGWLFVCVLVPYAGPAAYFLFGINRVRSRARGIKYPFLTIGYEAERGDAPKLVSDAKGLRAIGERVTGEALSAGNAITMLHNGDAAYPEMISSIDAARQRVLLATYIMKTDDVGMAFTDALANAVSRGVEVLVLVDGVGEKYAWPRARKMMRKRGITVARFLPPRLFPPSIHLNLRNHRKILVADQDVAYVGGMNISDENVATDEKPRSVSDVHFAVRGPVVSDVAEVFYRDWQFTTGASCPDEPEAPPVDDGHAKCRVIPDGPDGELDALALTIQTVISSASQSVDIMTPYFVPSRELITSLQAAKLRGARVRIVLPGKNNLFYMHWANRNTLAELLVWGIEAYYQPAPFCHSKLLCVDSEYSLIGSANLDPRSLRLNFEIGVEVMSEDLNAEIREHIETTISTSAPVTREEIKSRRVTTRLRDSLAGLLSPYL